MKKLLLVLLVVTLASFLFVGCLPGVVTDDEDEDEDEPVVDEICPTVSVATEVEINGKNYIKGGSRTITVTFTEATEPVSVYVGASIKDNPDGVPDSAVEVVMYADADKKVYTGKYAFGSDTDDCGVGYIYVVTCATCAPCKFAYTVDEDGPCSSIKIYEYPETGCPCGGVNLRFVTPSAADDCDVTSFCGDDCSGLDIYTVDLYKADPFGVCCDIPCIPPVAICSGTGCDIDCTLPCFNANDYFLFSSTESRTFYAVISLLDKVENKTRYYATIDLDSANTIKAIKEYGVAAGTTCPDWITPTDTGVTSLEIGGAVTATGCP